jgi:hypothetical protein
MVKPTFIGKYLGGLMRYFMLSGQSAFKPNLTTAPEFITNTETYDFEKEKLVLIEMLSRFKNMDTRFTAQIHPFFGKMTPKHWDELTIKHLDHHLRQFGA